MLTSLIRFVFISFLFFSTAVFSAENVNNPTEQVAPQNTSNTQLPEWFYRELTSIRKDVSVLDATGASKEQIQELKERIGKVEFRLEETQLRVDDKLNEQSGRIEDIADSNAFSITLFSVITAVLGTLVALITIINSWRANREAVAKAEDAAQEMLKEWTRVKEKVLTEKFDQKLAELSERHEKIFQKIRDNTEEQAFDNELTEAYTLSSNKNRNDDALSRINHVIRKVENSNVVVHQRTHAKALYYKALIFDIAAQPEREIGTYDELFMRFGESKDISIQEQIAKALVNKAATFGEQSKLADAIATYEQLLELLKDSKETPIQEQVAMAFCNKAELVLATDSKDAAINAIKDAIFFIKDGNKQDRAAMELLSFIIEETTVSSVFRKIEDIPESENFEWRFDEARHIIESLDSPRKEQVEAFARYFEDHHNKAKLKEELDQISKL